jgi:mRNA interferase HigB
MNASSKSELFEKASKYPDGTKALQYWFDVTRAAEWRNLEDIRQDFPATDLVGALAIFSIKGNRYRLIARMVFQYQRVFIKECLTHAEYSKGAWKRWLP